MRPKYKRLNVIAQMIEGDYTHIWDMCCDHGFLGMELLERGQPSVHFVDIQEHLVALVGAELERMSFDGQWHCHCCDAASVDLPDESPQLVVIAGVGGDTCVDMVRSIVERHPGQQLEFLLCPVRQMEHVRFELDALGLGLISDTLMLERGKYHEIMHLSSASQVPIGAIGQCFWDADDAGQARYRRSRMQYLSNAKLAGRGGTTEALQAYLTLEEELEQSRYSSRLRQFAPHASPKR